MAEDLRRLGDAEGLRHLNAMCTEKSLPVWIMIDLERVVSHSGASNSNFIDLLLDSLQTPVGSDSLGFGVGAFVEIYPRSTDVQKDRMVKAAEAALFSESGYTRLQAGMASQRSERIRRPGR